jgi:erythrocyte band 7 integral membrane protein
MSVVSIEDYDDSTIDLKEGGQISDGINTRKSDDVSDCGRCIGTLFLGISILLIIVTFPISIFMCIRIIQEYERAVIFRLGRIMKNGTVGPGLFFVVPCVDQVMFLLIYTWREV